MDNVILGCYFPSRKAWYSHVHAVANAQSQHASVCHSLDHAGWSLGEWALWEGVCPEHAWLDRSKMSQWLWPGLSTPNKVMMCMRHGTEISLALKAGFKMIACSTGCNFQSPSFCTLVPLALCVVSGFMAELCFLGDYRKKLNYLKKCEERIYHCDSWSSPGDVCKGIYLLACGCWVRSLQRHGIMAVVQFLLPAVGCGPCLCLYTTKGEKSKKVIKQSMNFSHRLPVQSFFSFLR